MKQEPSAETAILKNQDDDEHARDQHGQSWRHPSMQNTRRQIMVEIGDEQRDAGQCEAE